MQQVLPGYRRMEVEGFRQLLPKGRGETLSSPGINNKELKKNANELSKVFRSL